MRVRERAGEPAKASLFKTLFEEYNRNILFLDGGGGGGASRFHKTNAPFVWLLFFLMRGCFLKISEFSTT